MNYELQAESLKYSSPTALALGKSEIYIINIKT